MEIPGAVVDYYDTVTRTMGGAANTQEFFRLFIVPGMKHCSGGDGAFAIDYLSYMEDWVERHHAPDRIVGAHVDDVYLLSHNVETEGSDKEHIWLTALKLPFPLDSAAPITFKRPVFPYPLVARYKGHGDSNNADNFEAVAGSPPYDALPDGIR